MPAWPTIIRSQIKQLTMQPGKIAAIRPSDRSHSPLSFIPFAYGQFSQRLSSRPKRNVRE
jgi:hypothetical protein